MSDDNEHGREHARALESEIMRLTSRPVIEPAEANNLVRLLGSKRVSYTGDEVPTINALLEKLVRIANHKG